MKNFKEFYANENTTADDPHSVEILTVSNPDAEFGNIGGLKWQGDADNEYIFGTSWLDKLYGGAGDDVIYGLEEDDFIYGNDGVDRIFGDAGDDNLVTGDNDTVGDGDFASGGTGNDII